MTKEGDLVVDPYMGVGTTAVASALHNRKAAGADIQPAYLEIARERLAAVTSGTLRRRPLNQPIYEPASGMKLAQRPEEWENGIG